ncbi:sensor histidine kinase [Paenibacillus sp. y28]|uniref:sensor histidine kinase n=1 Tax=Paenibacillus sp. y28 TaxID=3129110 RepID=UPI0030161E55
MELSYYLRASFDFQNDEQLTTVHKELELVKSYLILEKARFDERLHVEYTVEGNLNARIPPLSIQPIVENAVRHGLMQKSQGGTIQINITITELEVSVVVADDGMGMRPERMQQVLSEDDRSGGVGLRNVHRRLLTLYGKGLDIESEWRRGTIVSFAVPRAMPEMLQTKLA